MASRPPVTMLGAKLLELAVVEAGLRFQHGKYPTPHRRRSLAAPDRCQGVPRDVRPWRRHALFVFASIGTTIARGRDDRLSPSPTAPRSSWQPASRPRRSRPECGWRGSGGSTASARRLRQSRRARNRDAASATFALRSGLALGPVRRTVVVVAVCWSAAAPRTRSRPPVDARLPRAAHGPRARSNRRRRSPCSPSPASPPHAVADRR